MFDSIQNAVEQKAIGSYSSEDSCLVVVDKHLNEDNWFKIKKDVRNPKPISYEDKECHEGKLPVPNFYGEWWSETEETLTKLKGYQLYVLEAESGKFMDEEKLPNGMYTPKGWEHGYSKGVAINKETGTVIFWADIW